MGFAGLSDKAKSVWGPVKGVGYANGLGDAEKGCFRAQSREAARPLTGRLDMNEVVMMDGAEPKKILQTAIDKKVTAIMSYLSKGKWHVAKVLLIGLTDDRLNVQSVHSERKQHPINIQVDQPVGMSFKYEYGKFVFDTTVVALEPSADQTGGGTVVLTVPHRIEVVQRRSYFRVEVPGSLKVNVTLWHRRSKPDGQNETRDEAEDTSRYCHGRLVDISAGGAQVVIDAHSPSAGPQFKKGQFITMRFTPLPYETPLLFNAQIRNALPRTDGESIYLGLQIVGLEASLEGRKVLTRLVGVAERYYRMNQSGAKCQDRRSVPSEV